MFQASAVLSALAVLLAACATVLEPEQTSTTRLKIVATTTILGDVARNIVGADATVEVLIPVGADPHAFQASSQQVAAIQEADLVIANGLLLEEGLIDVLEGAEADGANVLELAGQLDPILLGSGRKDSHVSLDPVRMADGARLIAVELAAIDPGVDWMSRAESYATELAAADKQIEEILAVIPRESRKLVTNHDVLGYFAERYGLEVVGVVIAGGSTLADPSSAGLAALVAKIEREEVRAIFVGMIETSVLAEAIAAEAGGGVEVVELYIASLGVPGSGADTLIGMLITDAERIAAALT